MPCRVRDRGRVELEHDIGTGRRRRRHGRLLGQSRNRRQQGSGVRVCRGVEHRVHTARFDDPAGAHDDDTVGVLRHDTHVVSDEQDAHAGSGAQAVEQRQDLGLDRDVEGCGGLVGDEQIGFAARASAIATRCFCPPESWCG